MKLNKRFLTAAAAVLLPASFALAQGGPPPHEGGPFGQHEIAFLSDYLDLSDAQQTQVKQLMSNERTSLKPLMEQERQSHEQMKALVESATFDEAKAQTIASAQSQISAQIMVAKARTDFQIYQLLTADQKTKLAQLNAKREARMTQRMQQQQDAPPVE